MFKKGDMAVYPTQGVGVIENIEMREFSGQSQSFYVLRIVGSDMTIMVPTNNVANVGMRGLIDQENIPSIFEVLGVPGTGGKIASWSRRQREYQDKLKSGDLHEVASVLRELYLISDNKDLSYGEKKVLEQARRLLVTEVALSQGSEEASVIDQLEEIFH